MSPSKNLLVLLALPLAVFSSPVNFAKEIRDVVYVTVQEEAPVVVETMVVTLTEGAAPPAQPTPAPAPAPEVVQVVRPAQAAAPVVKQEVKPEVKPEVKVAPVVTTSAAPPVVAPVATQAPAAPSAAADSFEGKMLADHNYFRAQHGVSDLVWNATLASQSADNTNKCVFAHSGQEGAGENIAAGAPLSVGTTVNMWALERTQYDFASGGFSSATGHFTQVAWKATTSVGCAEKTCGDGQTYVTCRYFPAGNFAGEFQNNVFKQVSGDASKGVAE